MFGLVLFLNYIFMMMVIVNSYGGLEYLNLISLIIFCEDLLKVNEFEELFEDY